VKFKSIARAETERAREDAAREAERIRADAAGARDELRAALESRAQVLNESREELRARAERAEQGWTAALAELGKARPGAGTAEPPVVSRRRRSGQPPRVGDQLTRTPALAR
jgi:hypothetical protein